MPWSLAILLSIPVGGLIAVIVVATLLRVPVRPVCRECGATCAPEGLTACPTCGGGLSPGRRSAARSAVISLFSRSLVVLCLSLALIALLIYAAAGVGILH